MSTNRRRPSLLGGLLWTSLGLLFLFRNFGVGPSFWNIAGHYWPVLLILLGLGKIIDYYRKRSGVSLRIGELFVILLILAVGSALTKISDTHFNDVFRNIPISIGGSQVQVGQWLGTSYTYTQETAYPVTTPTVLKIENSYGMVSVAPGSDHEVRIRLRKIVYQDDEARAKEIADRIKLEGGPEGKAEATGFLIRTNREELSDKGYRYNTDMEILVPNKSQIQIRNSFGEVRAANLDARLDLSTTHRALDVRNCSGDFVVSNRFSESRLVNLTGNVKVEGRGRVHVESIKGDVSIQNEYSPVEVSDVEGKVAVSNNESTISLDKISQPVTVDARGTELTVRNLASSLKATTSYRGVQISDIASDVVLDSRYSNVSLKDIKGAVEIVSDSDHINAEDLRGKLTIKAQRTGISLDGVDGPVDIHTSLKNVALNNYKDACTITNEYADVSLSTGALSLRDTMVKNRNGSINLSLPEGAGFQIDAIARNGRVDCRYPGLQPLSEGDTATLRGKTKDGGPRIQLETDYGSIRMDLRESEGPGPPRPPRREPRRPRRIDFTR